MGSFPAVRLSADPDVRMAPSRQMTASRQWVYEDVFDASPMSVAQVRWFVAHHLRVHDLGCLVDDVQLVAAS
jgi:hypothetical protein